MMMRPSSRQIRWAWLAAGTSVLILLVYFFYLRRDTDSGPFDLIICNGQILDGLGHPPYRADIGIRNGRIVAIGLIEKASGARIIDAEDQIVAPGFIDVHTHVERNLPEGSQPFRAANFIYQG